MGFMTRLLERWLRSAFTYSEDGRGYDRCRRIRPSKPSYVAGNAFEPLEPRVLLSAGELDPTFGVGGATLSNFSGSMDGATSMAVLSDGKILLGGTAGTWPAEDFCVARYNADGSLDTSFGTDGATLTHLGDSNDIVRQGEVSGLAVQGDGKILLGGYCYQESAGGWNFALVRYKSDGSLDPTFGHGGIVLTDLGSQYDFGFALAVQDDGKILLAGSSVQSGLGHVFAVVCYNSDGSLDSSFGSGGKLFTNLGGGDDDSSDEANCIAVQPDGKILLGGQSSQIDTHLDFAMVRCNSDGSLDTSFGEDGKVVTNLGGYNDEALTVALQDDGKILLGGRSNASGDGDFAVARYNGDGKLDTSFGAGGKALTDLGSPQDIGVSLAVQEDGKILLGGYTYPAPAQMALVRYNSDGSLDSSFGTGGKVLTSFGTDDGGTGLALLPNGDILQCGGSNGDGEPDDFALVRYLGDNAVLPVAGDADQNGVVDGQDFVTLAVNYTGSGQPRQFLKTWSQGDFDGDGDVDGQDFVLLAVNYTGSETTSVQDDSTTTTQLSAASTTIGAVMLADQIAQPAARRPGPVRQAESGDLAVVPTAAPLESSDGYQPALTAAEWSKPEQAQFVPTVLWNPGPRAPVQLADAPMLDALADVLDPLKPLELLLV